MNQAMDDEIRVFVDAAKEIAGTIEKMEATLSEAKRTYDKVVCDDIPALLHEHGLSKVTLEDGTVVSIDTVYTVTQRDRIALMDWLTETGNDAIVRQEYTFPKGAELGAVDEYLRSTGIDYTREISIHPMSLKKAVKDMAESGSGLPPEEAAETRIFERARIR